MPVLDRPIEIEDISSSNGNTRGEWGVLLHNDELNPMDYVEQVLIAVTNCSQEEAHMEMWEAHTYGKAFCHFGTQEECSKVSWALGTYRLKSEVVKDPALS